jgi:anthranilate phosphoribosyltransferase
MQSLLSMLLDQQDLSATQMREAMHLITSEQASPAQIGAFLMSMTQKQITKTELTEAILFLRQQSLINFDPSSIPSELQNRMVDCCGTGGDGLKTLNISTAVSFVLAGLGIAVAKHGNRAASSQTGAYDVLQALGVETDLPAEHIVSTLEKNNFVFFMASRFYQALKPLSSIRKELGFRTFFNITGPMLNPARVRKQLIGVYDKKPMPLMAETLRDLGTESLCLVSAHNHMDEITLSGDTYCLAFEKYGDIKEYVLTPEDFGLPLYPVEMIMGGDAHTNAQALRDLLQGKPSAYRDFVCANAAPLICMAEHADDFKEAVLLAQKSIDDGLAHQVFQSSLKKM